MKIFEIYTSDGTSTLYSFGNEESRVLYGQRKYGEFKYGSFKNDGVVLNSDVFFQADSLCSELMAGEISLTISANKVLEIPKNAKAKLYKHNGDLLVSFFIKSAQRTSPQTYSISGYDYIGKAEDTDCPGLFAENKTLEYVVQTAFVDKGIPVVLGDDVKNIIVSGSALPNTYNMREILQHLCVAYGLRATTLGIDGIYLFSKDAETEPKQYTESEIKENPIIEKKEEEIGTISIERSFVVETSDPTTGTWGYVPINIEQNSTSVVFNGITSPINFEIKPVIYDAKSKAPQDGLTKALRKGTVIKAPLDARVDNEPFGKTVGDYATAELTAGNAVTVTIDHQKLQEIAQELNNDRGEDGVAWLMRPAIAEAEYALVAFGGIKVAKNSEVEDSYEVQVDESKNVVSFETPFVSERAKQDILNCYSVEETVNFGIEYMDEQLFDIVLLPKIYDYPLRTMITNIELSYSAHSIFAYITADVLNQINEEV